MKIFTRTRLSTFQIIFFSFFGMILIGTLLLMLPISNAAGEVTPFINALFTATSSACVTGLIVYDTATYWSAFGQGVLLTLIQIGGLGVVTVAVAIARVSGKKIGVMQRSTMQESISAPQIGGIVEITGYIIKTTIIFELIGAIIMMPVFVRDFGIRGIWMSVFHSVSAFCNAGFDLMGTKEQFSSLTYYSTQPLINIVIMALIIIGGIGFFVWDDIKVNKLRFRKYRLHTKVVITTTLVLIFIPALVLFFYDYRDLGVRERILKSLFQAITPRTAGFNTTDLTELSGPSQVIMAVLMLIGGSPGSTAGGMKTTTIAVLIFLAISVFSRKEDVECFGRRVPWKIIMNAAAIFILYIILFIISGIAICIIESLPISVCLFETASAVGTVGLTLGITPTLSTASKLILALLMFLGRVGGLTIIFSTAISVKHNVSKKPQERIAVG